MNTIKISRCSGLLALLLAAPWPVTARAGHRLFTEDTGTQGAGHYQPELTHDLSTYERASTESRTRSINSVFSAGLTDNLDFIITLPHERLTEETGVSKTTIKGYSDVEIAAKWRFYEAGALSFALRPGLGLPSGNEDKGLSLVAEDSAVAEAVLGVEELREAGDENYDKGGEFVHRRRKKNDRDDDSQY